MITVEKELRKEIARIRRNDPSNSAAMCAEISFEDEVECGISRAFAASKWLESLMARRG